MKYLISALLLHSQCVLPMGDMNCQDGLLKRQIEYYRARATEYDQWFLRMGNYDHGKELNECWFNEVDEVTLAVKRFNPSEEVLELACGTGWWTETLAKYADRITAIDASPEVIAINQKKLVGHKEKIIYQQADLFSWEPDKQYDVIFFSFWLSHVPADLFEKFWGSVVKALKPNGRVFFIDSVASSSVHSMPVEHQETQLRRLSNGQEFEIVKIYYTPDQLTKKLSELGLKSEINQTERYFLFGSIKS